MEPGALRWAECGALALTGDADGDPLTPRSDVAPVLDALLAPWGLDAGVMAERAAVLGLSRQGSVSCGGSTRLLPSADGWVAVALPRPDDVASVPAWLGLDREAPSPDEVWPLVAEVVRGRRSGELVQRASVLGLACSAADEIEVPSGRSTASEVGPVGSPPVPVETLPNLEGRLVVDLSALWAGPLCADLLGRAGATVVKVEDPRRPDGGRLRPAFHDLLNAGKASVAVDLSTGDGRAALRRLVRSADVVVTSSRRRAFEQLDLMPADLPGAAVWVAITGHGWDVDRVGFGDDCAVAGGLLAWHPDDGAPRFAADAVADPVTGVFAAVRAMHALGRGEPVLLDCALAASAAAVRSVGPARLGPGCPAAPRVRTSSGAARPLGADTARVLASLPA